MSTRLTTYFLVVLMAAPVVLAKNKKKQVLPDFVLKARTVFVVIDPGAGEPLTNPTANRTAQDTVERALMQWGRFNLVMSAQTADLVVAIRTGHANGPTISNSPADNRPVIVQPSGGDVRVGGQVGRPPDLNDPGIGASPDRRPGIRHEIGSSEDIFAVYRGGDEYPLDAAPVWRYMAKGALNAPQVPAVEQFRKAITDSEKAAVRKP